jgi:hydrogenase nickel incorporation protein HypB
MDSYRVIEIKKNVFAGNDGRAAVLRAELKASGLFLLNLMSSPGAGKTTTLLRTIERLAGELRLGIMEADIDSDVDARAVSAAGARVVQLHTGGMCHLDAEMTRQGLAALGTEGLDLAILENVGNLICTADFDTGASKNAVILSVPEGDDKPLKYPHMFEVADVILVNKIDAMSFFDFGMEAFRKRAEKLNPKTRIIPVSAKTGEGMDEWADWLRNQVKIWKEA